MTTSTLFSIGSSDEVIELVDTVKFTVTPANSKVSLGDEVALTINSIADGIIDGESSTSLNLV